MTYWEQIEDSQMNLSNHSQSHKLEICITEAHCKALDIGMNEKKNITVISV